MTAISALREFVTKHQPIEDPEPEDIHERLRRGVKKFLNDAGYPHLTVSVADHPGASHEVCTITAQAHHSGVSRNHVNEIHQTFGECARSAFVIVANEVLGSREITDRNWHASLEITKDSA